jgi:hypothetical protein
MMLESARYLTMAYITSESCTSNIPWKTNTHENKIYTSPSQTVMKNWYIYWPHSQTSLPNFFLFLSSGF